MAMDVQYAIANRIRERVPDLKQVGGAIELDAIVSGAVVPISPSAYVVLTGERADDDDGFTGRLMQRVTSAYTVVYVVQDYSDATGSAIAPELQRLRTAVRNALLGWVPDPDNGEPVRAAECALIDVINGTTIWGDGYLINHYWSEQ